MFGLDNETIQDLKIIFSKNPQIKKVIIHGSRAIGNYCHGSDIDITLIGENLTLNNSVYPLMNTIDELYLPYMFDISVFNQIDEKNLIEHISISKVMEKCFI